MSEAALLRNVRSQHVLHIVCVILMSDDGIAIDGDVRCGKNYLIQKVAL